MSGETLSETLCLHVVSQLLELSVQFVTPSSSGSSLITDYERTVSLQWVWDLQDLAKQPVCRITTRAWKILCRITALSVTRYSCPICSKSIFDMSSSWRRMDEENCKLLTETQKPLQLASLVPTVPAAEYAIESAILVITFRVRGTIAVEFINSIQGAGPLFMLFYLFVHQVRRKSQSIMKK
ncbi:hypothetical protein IFM89_013036 [Coptis chinensis]|uniref:Uncharacterized protein n=1 Tax=Coptis chinensis TaxID=261450 RepID=A0A835GYM6_9MAGN|nr:hypothetical protein IFM89_013036 [Coptis chinensis]